MRRAFLVMIERHADHACRIFNFQKAYAVCPELPVSTMTLTCYLGQILDELLIAGELQESSKKSVLRVVRLQGSESYWYPN